MMMLKQFFAMAALAALITIASAASASSTISSYSQFQTWLPIIFIAILLSITIVSVYYLAGVLLNNAEVKAGAMSELGNAIGTGILTLIVIGAFVLVGSGQLSLVSLISPSSISTVCSQLKGAGITLLDSQGTFGSSPTPTSTVCSAVAAITSGNTGGDITPQIDYGLFSTYVITANLTNQAANNLDAFYVFSGWIGFLSEFTATTAVCAPATCVIPGTEIATIFKVENKYKPLAGYGMITSIIKPAQTEAALTFYLMLTQLIITTFFLFAWPYMLAAGIILHSTLFTRRLGGLLASLSVAAVLIYPLLYMMEYAAFTTQTLSPIGASNLPTAQMALYEQPSSGNPIVYGVQSTGVGGYAPASQVQNSGCASNQYIYENVCGYAGTRVGGCVSQPTSSLCTSIAPSNLDFFVLPNAAEVLRYTHCLPEPGGLLGQEAAFTLPYLVGGGLFGEVLSGIGSLFGALPFTPLNLYNGCTPDNAINAALAMTNMYGMGFVVGVMLPIINILVALAAMSGFATLLGGDTDIAGLSKLM